MFERDTFEVALALRAAMARLNRRLRTTAREPGLTATKHSVLGHLYRDGPSTPGALAAAEGIQPQSLTRVLAELEESGNAFRHQDPIDRRQFKMDITQQGRKAVQQDAKRRAIWLAEAMTSSLSTTEQEFLKLTAQLLDRLADWKEEQLPQ